MENLNLKGQVWMRGRERGLAAGVFGSVGEDVGCGMSDVGAGGDVGCGMGDVGCEEARDGVFFGAGGLEEGFEVFGGEGWEPVDGEVCGGVFEFGGGGWWRGR